MADLQRVLKVQDEKEKRVLSDLMLTVDILTKELEEVRGVA